MNRKLIFIDHALHSRTQSSAFFQQVLKQRFDVHTWHIEPDGPWNAESIEFPSDVDIVVVWQMDFMAPIFIARGLPTIVVPMYDGSANMPDLHWQWASQARFISFSWNLHDRIRLLGCQSLLVKYYQQPVLEQALPEFDGYRIFLWQRRPEEGINGDMVVRFFGDQITSLHIHDVPDDPFVNGQSYYELAIESGVTTVSKWFEDHFKYEAVLERCNVFIAPRRSEGIGMAFLEAMARGMLVLAQDLPTHTEYLANWVNGVLFNADQINFTHFDLGVAQRIARYGWLSTIEGWKEWCATVPNILDFIEHAPKPNPIDESAAAILSRELPRAYVAGINPYVDFLERNIEIIREMSSVKIASPRGNRKFAVGPEAIFNDVEEVYQRSIEFTQGAARSYLADGWGLDEVDGVWIVGQAASLVFRMRLVDDPIATIAIWCRSPPGLEIPTTVIVLLNGQNVRQLSNL